MPKNDDIAREPSAADLLGEDSVPGVADLLADQDGPVAAETNDAVAVEDVGIDGVVEVEEERLHPILTNEEVRQAQEKARAKVAADQKKQAMDALVALEMAKLKGPAGLVTGDPRKDEMVTFSLDLAEHSDGITLNGHKFFHGHTYTLPRHVYDTMREVQSRGHNHQNELDGKGIVDRARRPYLTQISERDGAVRNAPQMVA